MIGTFGVILEDTVGRWGGILRTEVWRGRERDHARIRPQK